MTSFKEIVNMSEAKQLRLVQDFPEEVLFETKGVGLSSEALKTMIGLLGIGQIFDKDDMFKNLNLFEILSDEKKKNVSFKPIVKNIKNYFKEKENIDIEEELSIREEKTKEFFNRKNS